MNETNRREISSEDLLKEAASIVSEDMEKDLEEYKMRAESLSPEEAPVDEAFLKFAKEYDARRRSKKRVGKILKTAAVFLLSIVAVGGIAIETSEAFRAKFFDLVLNKDTGFIELTPETQSEKELTDDLSGYWYPEYLPEGCKLTSSEDNDFMLKFTFMPEDEAFVIDLTEYDPDGLSMQHNMDINTVEEVTVGEYEAYLFTNEKDQNFTLVWQVENKVLNMMAYDYTDREEFLKIAESVKYVE